VGWNVKKQTRRFEAVSLSEVFKSATDIDAKAKVHRLTIKEEPYAVSGHAPDSGKPASSEQKMRESSS